ncbi:hypothetical protein MAPG_01175 [Magnaporthiopsis poae ATCC 64411]|uniref:Uncharacterized protein n=1 Tax=Magnaporthiopsis poae (strain ATCC 64411 / 73-15) TaxID=644358 RepID=A0A0C4DN03_MAGP6|nr:hypothetical protein MAPG_01175 [Magnaporthiopsis poae ATCC 64411]
MCFGSSRSKKTHATGSSGKHQPAGRGGVLRFERAVRYDFRAGLPFASALWIPSEPPRRDGERKDAAAADAVSDRG